MILKFVSRATNIKNTTVAELRVLALTSIVVDYLIFNG